MRIVVDRRLLGIVALLVAVLCACVSSVSSAKAEGGCSNELQRAEQPYGLALPDCRAYEMVSPLAKDDNDAIATGLPPLKVRSSVSGEAVTYDSWGAFAGPATALSTDQYVSRRGPDGWATQNITPAGGSGGAEGAAHEGPFQTLLFTPELTAGVADVPTPTGYPSLASDAPAGFTNLYVADLASGSYQTVTNVAPPGIPPDVFETFEATGREEAMFPSPFSVGASRDLSRVFFEVRSALTPGAAAGNLPNLYEWWNGHLSLVDVTPSGEPMAGGAQPGEGEPSNTLFTTGAGQWHSVSEDGSRVFFTSPALIEAEEEPFRKNPGNELQADEEYLAKNGVALDKPQLFARVDGSHTVEVSASQRTDCADHNPCSGTPEPDPQGPLSARFLAASSTGSRVFFTSSSELTDNAYTGPTDNAANLYEYDLETGKLTDLSVDTGDPNGAAVLGLVDESEDGSYVYFVAEGVLAGKAVAGRPNLYVAHAGTTTFIATLAVGDFIDWEEAPNRTVEAPPGRRQALYGPSHDQARVTPDGMHLAFFSSEQLTGYNNRPAEPSPCQNLIDVAEEEFGRGACKEVYVYDASSGSLACASCNPSGAPPIGAASMSGGAGITAELGGFYVTNSWSADGSRLFFQTEDALVAHDTNGLQDVYEYEGGHVYPVSNVVGDAASLFLDASASGNDVFVGTAAQLLGSDTDFRIDVYDARVGGGFPVASGPPACDNGDSCKGASPAQPGVFGAPASATFVGAGNVTRAVAPTPVVKKKGKSKLKKKPRKHGKPKHRRGGKAKKSVSRRAARSRGGQGR